MDPSQERDTTDDQHVAAPAGIGLKLTVGTPRFGFRSYFSTDWLHAARDMSRRAGAIEAVHFGRSKSDRTHRASVLGSLQASVAFFEAAINELYRDAVDGHGFTDDGYLAPVDPAARDRAATIWTESSDGRRLVTLAKYQLFMSSCSAERFDQGAQSFQDAALLIQLRNAVVHYEPELVWGDDVHRFETKLRGRFPDNALMVGSGNAWWPSHCLGHGLAEWGVAAALTFADEAMRRIGVTPNYQRQRS